VLLILIALTVSLKALIQGTNGKGSQA